MKSFVLPGSFRKSSEFEVSFRVNREYVEYLFCTDPSYLNIVSRASRRRDDKREYVCKEVKNVSGRGWEGMREDDSRPISNKREGIGKTRV